ncbi:MAG: bifunctional 3-oxoadipate enol-lactonase/4-carboxymuconolactone decarboxylase PcaDC [Yoonia sp.]|uniref:bifunctional 3-oxoadipate enol-lactonase/4-carboxymuconolactone decarboxylase PcaDC n=1 Tax=Yoonia sp. TaxID=2212373 RepID=UPI003EF7F5B0
MQAITLNEQLIAYRHRPSAGRTVVFANSLGSDQSLWDSVCDHLGRGYGTLTYDLRGHGQSGLSRGFSIDDMADDLIALLEHLGLRDVLLCGVSVSGMIAQSVAARRPDLLSGVILCNTAAKIGTEERWSDRIAAVKADGIEAIADAILQNWLAADFKPAHPDDWQACRNMLCRVPADGYAAVCDAIRRADLTNGTAGITVPTHCVGGAEDQSVTAQQVTDLAKLIGGAELTIFDGVGHLPPLEVPAEMARLIEDFDTTTKSRFDQGMAVRRSVLGDAHVDRAEAAKTDFDLPFQTLITEGAWGTVWASEGISRRERSMITLALLAATGNFEEIPMHVRATARTGATVRDIQEAFQHVAIYAGVPRANHALKLSKQTLAEMEAQSND